MQIAIKNLGKRFNQQWIFRRLNHEFTTGKTYAITGYNGSGKSTLLQIIAGAMEKSEGEIHFSLNGQDIKTEDHFKHISFSAPYLELIEELTLEEFLAFHFSFKPILPNTTIAQIIDRIGLNGAEKKQMSQFSSGMKQRVKLGQAFFSHVPVLMLDEPTANLDQQGIDLYLSLISDFSPEKLTVICSNDEHEISFCSERVDIIQYK